MKLVLSCGHDGKILMWGPGGGVVDKIQVCVLFVALFVILQTFSTATLRLMTCSLDS